MGLFDGAFGGGGQGILPDWLFNPQLMQNQPNAMGGDNFADRWSAANALPPMQTAPPTQGGSIFGGLGYEPLGWSGGGGGANPALIAAMNSPSQTAMRPAINPYNAADEGGMPPAAQPTVGQAQGGARPSVGLPIPDGLSSLNLPSGNPLAGLGALLSGGGAPQGSYQSPLGSFDPLNRGGALSGAGDWINNNRTGLALFGAGIAGGGGKGNWNAGLSDALRGMAMGGQIDQKQQSEIQSQNAAYQAVKAAGGTEAQALAARSNPEVFKAIAPELFSGWKLVKTGSNPITGDQFMMQGPGGQLRPLDSFVKGGGGESSAGPGGGQVGGAGMLAPGVKQYDASLTGDAYLAQFSPELQSAVKAYIKGDVMPTGNPRLQGIANAAKTIAQKYGQDIGQPVSDALYSEKRKFRTELGSNSPSSVGGQSKAFVQGIEHALDLGGELKKLENWNGFGIPIVAATANTIRQGMSNEQHAIADKAAGIGQTLAGEVGKLFSGSAGGGVHEREMTRARFSTVRSRPQLAAALEATLETMEGGLTALEARKDAVMGPNSGVELIPQQTRDKIEKLRGIISELKGEGQPAAAKPGVVKWEVGPNGVPRPVSK